VGALAALLAGLALAAPSAEVPLSGVDNVSRWAYVMQRVVVRDLPDATGQPVGVLPTVTPEGETNVVLAYAAERDAAERLWVRVPLSALPNGRTGWIPRDALGDLHRIRTHLVIDRARLRAVLLRDGRPIFSTRIGVGRPRWPTPAGEFYIRVRLEHYGDPFYGPVAFGTNARSPWLTDWPKGGVVGIHGTDSPQLLPGRVSHGCIRMRNAAIQRLARLMPLGTPVSIR
jgi:lipoprotein-anchoring transpeptidase ErfK/SrfK